MPAVISHQAPVEQFPAYFGQRRFTVPTLSQHLGISATTIYKWMETGFRGIKLKATRLGAVWYITESDLDEFIAECQAAPTPPGRGRQKVSKAREAGRRRRHA